MSWPVWVLCLCVVIVAWVDWRTRKIPNLLLLLLLAGYIGGWLYTGQNLFGISLQMIVLGFFTGLLLLLPGYLLGKLGAGDVKLLAVYGLFIGPMGVVVCMALAGILMGLYAASQKFQANETIPKHAAVDTRLPMGPFLAMGVLGWLLIMALA